MVDGSAVALLGNVCSKLGGREFESRRHFFVFFH